ncbi:MAG: RNA polymerase III subunit C82 [Piccolia ochrophora]|nr:MAG: RNA polymerase III subunit C82 [Piccolia ochrophora]
MSHHAEELCTLLVNDIYGELSSRVFKVLLRQGRLALPALAQHSKLPIRQLKHGLAVLIQQHLVLHYTSHNDENTHYEADWQSAYTMVRYGKIIELMQQRFGDDAGKLVSNLLLQGHARIEDLAKAYMEATGRNRHGSSADAPTTNGETHGSNATAETVDSPAPVQGKLASTVTSDMHRTLLKLLNAGFVKEVQEIQFHSFADNYNTAAQELRRAGLVGGTKGTKADLAFQEEARVKLKRWRDGDDEDQLNDISRPRSVDSPAPSRGTKRLKTNRNSWAPKDHDDVDYQYAEAGDAVPIFSDNLVVGVNAEKCKVAFRSRHLVTVAEQQIGTMTAKVYSELLRLLEMRIPRCHDPLETPIDDEDQLAQAPTVSTLVLSDSIDPSITLDSAIGKATTAVIDTADLDVPRKRKRKRIKHEEATVDGNASSDEEEEAQDMNGNIPEVIPDPESEDPGSEDYDDEEISTGPGTSLLQSRRKRLHDIRQHLRLLSEPPLELVTLMSNKSHGEWTVDFRTLTATLKRTALENIIHTRFGLLGLRLTRILLDKGKLDEKQLGNMSLTKQKDIRATVGAMHSAGFLALQEVPKDNSRAPSRTIYLWYVDVARVAKLVLEETYKTMARLLQRAASEREAIRGLLEKAERTDVVGKEEIYLSNGEREALRGWRDKEERLFGELGRLDELVGVLRDY